MVVGRLGDDPGDERAVALAVEREARCWRRSRTGATNLVFGEVRSLLEGLPVAIRDAGVEDRDRHALAAGTMIGEQIRPRLRRVDPARREEVPLQPSPTRPAVRPSARDRWGSRSPRRGRCSWGPRRRRPGWVRSLEASCWTLTPLGTLTTCSPDVGAETRLAHAHAGRQVPGDVRRGAGRVADHHLARHVVGCRRRGRFGDGGPSLLGGGRARDERRRRPPARPRRHGIWTR